MQAAAPATSEERKVVTVLFCDLVGFTAASEHADPEEVRARLRPYHQLLRTVIERYGGTVEKFIGDAVMAVFGAPVVHEDDAERAVRSGLEILEEIEELNEHTADLNLSVRIGVNTGEAVVTLGARPELGEGIVTGDVVNTASRLQGAAPVGSVVVGAGTHAATDRLFTYETLEPVELKGKSEPVALWRAVEARSRFGIDIARSYTSPLVGRELDLAILRATFDKALQGSSVQLVTIAGEPGVGKTRLVAELAAHVDSLPELIVWRQGRCLPYGDGIAFWALGEIVKAQAGILESDDAAAVAGKLDAAVPPATPEHDWVRARLDPLVGLEAAAGIGRDELFTAWRAFLEAVATETPAVLVVEDIHWADPAMLQFLEQLAEWSEGVPLFVVCTARPELFESHPGWSGGKRNVTTINLEPLSDADTARLIAALLDQTLLPAELQAVLLERASGNPLYAEEFVRMLRDRGLLQDGGRTLSLGEEAGAPFPESVQALIAARLDTLSPERKRLLQAAAVMGKIFWSGSVQALTGLDEAAVGEALHELTRKELVRPARTSSMAGQSEIAFWHALVRDVAYAQIPRAARAALHVAAAGWIESILGDRAEDQSEILAHHYERAIEYGDTSDEVRDAAVEHLSSAAYRGNALDVSRAVEQARRALALAPPESTHRNTALRRLASSLNIRGDVEEARALAETAVAEARAGGDPLEIAQAVSLAGITTSYGGLDLGVIDEILPTLDDAGPSKDLARVLNNFASFRAVSAAYEGAIALGERSLSMARELGLDDLEAEILGFLALSRFQMGSPGALEDMRRAATLSTERESGDANIARMNLAHCLWQADGSAAALAEVQGGAVNAAARGQRFTELWSRASAVEYLFDVGRHDEALVEGAAVVEMARAHGYDGAEGWAGSFVVMIEALRGRAAAAYDRLAELGRHADADHSSVALGAVARAMICVMAGRTAEAETAVGDAVRLGRDKPSNDRAERLAGLVRSALALGRADLAAELIDGVDGVVHVRPRAAVAAAGARIAEHEGRHEDAVGRYGLALEGWRSLGDAVESGHALLGRGRSRRALADPDAAKDLREARELFSKMGATALVREIDDLLGDEIARSS